MATLIELTDQDSGVGSNEATPESQNLSPTAQEKAANVVGAAVEAVAAQVEEASAAQVEEASAPSKNVPDGAAPSVLAHSVSDEDEEEDVDESLWERLWGLTEMFPERLRTTSANTVSTSMSLVKGSYELTRQVVWIAVSTSVILFAPVMFELERINVEEMMKQDRNRLVLGPGSAMTGSPAAPGLMPPPPTR